MEKTKNMKKDKKGRIKATYKREKTERKRKEIEYQMKGRQAKHITEKIIYPLIHRFTILDSCLLFKIP